MCLLLTSWWQNTTRCGEFDRCVITLPIGSTWHQRVTMVTSQVRLVERSCCGLVLDGIESGSSCFLSQTRTCKMWLSTCVCKHEILSAPHEIPPGTMRHTIRYPWHHDVLSYVLSTQRGGGTNNNSPQSHRVCHAKILKLGLLLMPRIWKQEVKDFLSIWDISDLLRRRGPRRGSRTRTGSRRGPRRRMSEISKFSTFQ